MVAFGLHFTYLLMHNMMSIILSSLAQLAWMHVNHLSGWHTCAYSVHNNFHCIKQSTCYRIKSSQNFTDVHVGSIDFGVHQFAHSSWSLHISHDQE